MSFRPPRTPHPFNVFSQELRRMTHRLNRFLDVLASITLVSLALYVGVATVGLSAAVS